MKDIRIVNRELSPEEMDYVNSGFDELILEEGLELESTDPISMVALDGEDLIGCSIGLIHKNGGLYSGWLHLTDLFVDKEFRNKGIGSILLKELEERARVLGIKKIWLWTSGSDTIRFYKRHGYTQFAEFENWYSDGSSRLGFRKNITPQNLDTGS